jgi:hypothetical protein
LEYCSLDIKDVRYLNIELSFTRRSEYSVKHGPVGAETFDCLHGIMEYGEAFLLLGICARRAKSREISREQTSALVIENEVRQLVGKIGVGWGAGDKDVGGL